MGKSVPIYSPFLIDKRDFFSTNELSKKTVKERAINKDYYFVDGNLSSIEQELDLLFTTLKDKKNYSEKFWLYCFYCCQMLQTYYQAYEKKEKVKVYQNLIEELDELYFKKDNPDKPKQTRFFERLESKLKADITSLVSTPVRSSKIKDWAGFTNIIRMQVIFAKLTVQQSLVVAKEAHLLERLFGKKVMNIDRCLNILSTTTATMNVLSVGVFATRFIMNAGTLLKHTFIPPTNESGLSLREKFYLAQERFIHELKLRHTQMINDMAWGTVNLFTNYANLFHIPGAVASWTMSAFLVFDLSMQAYQRWLAEQKYLTKKAQIEEELQSNPTDEQKEILESELKHLDINWTATNAKCWLNITAAMLLLGGFSASLMFALPAAVPACYLVCSFAISVYISADLYGDYRKKQLLLEHHQTQGKDIDADKKAVIQAGKDLAISLVKNTAIPMIIMGTFAVCWQAALVLTALYIGYEVGKGYLNHCLKADEISPKM